MFDAGELDRYARHIVLRDLGGPGQQKLKDARVLVIGAGGLGAPILMYLAAAGIGTLGIVDDDTVSLSNLQRQVIHGTADIGREKVASATDAIGRLNGHVSVISHPVRFDAGNAAGLMAGYDLVIDGSDNFETRFAASDAAFGARLPLVTGAVSEYDGSLTVLAPHLNGPDGRPNPTYRCLFPEPPPPGTVPTCAAAGVLGAVTGVIGTLAALEAIKWIAGIGEPLVGRLLMFSGRSMTFETISYRWNPANPLNGRR